MMKIQDEADRTLFVGNLDCSVKEDILYELFLQAGPLTKVNIARDKEGNLKSFGFVCFKHTESVPYAIALLNGIRLYGRPINLQYRFGSSYSTESTNQLQGSDNGFTALPTGSGTVPMGDGYASSPTMANMDNGYLPQAYFHFHGMMNPRLGPQNPAYGWVAPEPACYKPDLPWNKNGSFPSYSENISSCSAGPSSMSRDQTSPKEKQWGQTPASRKRKRNTETKYSDSDDSDTRIEEQERSKKPKKHKSKKKRRH
ncbi:splicing regulator RBM11 [Spea bombifrons]|uniref:splicing regulator RBM11 n=1 Tax=Spea bombifrons TaxID=233779 RepID=UPI00234B0BCB|nr:splicing regulator RBM11 [Spea bombifrons]